jgi:hypothetical protein
MISMTQTLKLGSGLIDLPTAQPSAVIKKLRKNIICYFYVESGCAKCALSLVDTITGCFLVSIL